jgi:L-2-hydroxycarboxylate dehydrogenase (NAD+)
LSQLVEVSIDEVDATCLAALSRIDMSAAERASTWEQLRYAELRGKASHGIARIPWMMGRLGGRGNAPMAPSFECGWMTSFDGGAHIGYHVADRTAILVAERTAASGFHLGVCRDAFPSGVLAFYLERMTKAGQLGVVFCTTPPLVRTRGATSRFLGTNPIAVGFPGAGGADFLCDVTTAATSFGQVLSSGYGAERFPGEALVTADDRRPDTNADLFDESGAFTGAILQEFATGTDRRHFALLAAIELLTVLLAGGKSGTGDFVVIGLDPGHFPQFDLDAARARMEEIAAAVAPERLPGRHAAAIAQENLGRGSLFVAQALWCEVAALAG